MKIAVIGTGYVGLVTGTCLAESGNEVTCIDIDRDEDRAVATRRSADLRAGTERTGRAESASQAAATSPPMPPRRQSTPQLIFLAVGTPPASDGSADLSSLWRVIEQLAPHLARESIVVTKSTVPVGTNAKLALGCES